MTLLPSAFNESVRNQRSYHFLQDYFEMSFLELTAFPRSLSKTACSSSVGGTARWQSDQTDSFAETIRHIGTRLTGTTDLIAESILQQGHAGGYTLMNEDAIESFQRVLIDLFRRNLAAEVLVGLYLSAAAGDCQPTTKALHARAHHSFIDPCHEIVKTINLGRDSVQIQDVVFPCG